jgi:hypothetical protein
VVCRQTVAEDIRPSADDLVINPLLCQPPPPFGNRFDKAREKRPDFEPVVESERFLAAVGRNETNADVRAARFDSSDELRGYVVGVDVDGQSEISDASNVGG